MSQISISIGERVYAPPVNYTNADLASIVANASFLWERLDSEGFTVDGEQAKSEIERRCDRWCQVAAQGNLDTFQKRLQWEGLHLDAVRPILGTVRITDNHPLPEWAQTLQQIMQTATGFMSASVSFLPTDPDNPLPFEDILLPAIAVARQQLLIRLGSEQLTEDSLPLSMLTEAAYQALERTLLQRLVELCTKTLDFEFSQVRPFVQNLLNLLGLETEDSNSKTHYTQFVERLLQSGLLTLFQKYPVLGRLVATAVNFWVEFTTEFLQRLAEDRAEIQRVFGSTIDIDKVAQIQTSLSDPHKRGRSVILLTFESGFKLVYKPKDLGLEVAFNEFLSWCNQHSQLLDFKIIQVLNRKSYGWVEYVEQQSCIDEASVKRFYQRAGMLLCVLYAFRGTDCHCENLIASGEHLVLIDMETLLHHEANLIDNSPFIQEFETAAAQRLWDSVLRTGMLPRWDFSSDRRIAYDISGLGSVDSGQAPRKLRRWQAINTDNMHQRYESVTFPLEKNLPRLGEVALSANDYQVEIATGFEQMYRFLMVNQDRLLAPDSPLAAMQNQQVRFIFRATQIYGTILQNAWAPDYLKNGVDYSIELDRLSYAFLVAQEKPHAWPILSAELQAMQQLDIPFFTASAASDDLSVGRNQTIQQYFKQPSYQQVLMQLQALDETDLARQVAIVQGSYYAKVAQTASKESEQWNVESLPLLNSQQLIAEARAIASELEARAIPDPDGSVNWIGLVYIPEAERFQLQVLNDSLYDGRSGIALFLAALYQVCGEPCFRNLALQTLQSLRRQIQTLDPESQQRKARLSGIGGTTGLGSTIYTFVKISQFLGDETLLQDAQVLCDWMTPELIAADKFLDIISGAAGAILCLLSLYGVTKEASVLEKAIACGQHLLTHRVSHEGAPKAWLTIGETPFTGFSHGAAGISYALLQLYAVTQDRNYLEAALEGIEYERSVFSESHANWPDFRGLAQTGQPMFPVQWCHGAAGIGLARLGSFKIVNIPEIEREIEIALQTTQRHALQAIDHLCCGNMGRVEVLLVGGQRYSRPDWYESAFQNAMNIVAKAKRTGAYKLFPNLPNSVFNPGFFPGTAGIGYQLLRLAHPEQLPSVLLWE
ncbi:type 2 lanthipeptide synthetase LanM family protein [Calothrix sp. NIES-2098]|uniref:type 2 lanthipeptide synthetase LanM family protein n=1 Tax=Calothrix sp. NIES-2098 TaxID=1954171 RepID=UPI000B61ED32|nr:lanthionine synthetase C family protein [Calothrix sp. NIES-2098]